MIYFNYCKKAFSILIFSAREIFRSKPYSRLYVNIDRCLSISGFWNQISVGGQGFGMLSFRIYHKSDSGGDILFSSFFSYVLILPKTVKGLSKKSCRFSYSDLL